MDPYRTDILAHFPDLRADRPASGRSPLRVVVDAGNGCLSTLAPAVLRQVGCRVVELFCTPDGTFPNRPPNPSVAANLSAARALVREAGADMGVAYDGDGDRVVFLDETGRVIESDQALVLLLRDALARRPGPVVYDIKCSDVVRREILSAGGEPLMERSGHAFIKARLRQAGAVLAGEASGHFFFPEIGGDDGLYAALRMISILVQAAPRSLSELVASVPPFFITPDIRVPRPLGDGPAVLARVAEAFADRPLSRLDGVRVQFEHGWLLCRISVTEPVVTVRMEADSSEHLAHIQRTILARVPDLKPPEKPARGS